MAAAEREAQGTIRRRASAEQGGECEAKALGCTPEGRRILAYSNPVDLRNFLAGLGGLGKSV